MNKQKPTGIRFIVKICYDNPEGKRAGTDYKTYREDEVDELIEDLGKSHGAYSNHSLQGAEILYGKGEDNNE